MVKPLLSKRIKPEKNKLNKNKHLNRHLNKHCWEIGCSGKLISGANWS
jgi:hypothetical protein